MIKMNQIKKGDYFITNNEGDLKIGEVVALDKFTKQVCIDEDGNEYWYHTNQLTSIPVSDKVLRTLKFTQILNTDGTVKYSKGAFRLLIPMQGDFSRMNIWYRDEHRMIFNPISVHELQNHFLAMTKVHLNDEVF